MTDSKELRGGRQVPLYNHQDQALLNLARSGEGLMSL